MKRNNLGALKAIVASIVFSVGALSTPSYGSNGVCDNGRGDAWEAINTVVGALPFLGDIAGLFVAGSELANQFACADSMQDLSANIERISKKTVNDALMNQLKTDYSSLAVLLEGDPAPGEIQYETIFTHAHLLEGRAEQLGYAAVDTQVGLASLKLFSRRAMVDQAINTDDSRRQYVRFTNAVQITKNRLSDLESSLEAHLDKFTTSLETYEDDWDAPYIYDVRGRVHFPDGSTAYTSWYDCSWSIFNDCRNSVRQQAEQAVQQLRNTRKNQIRNSIINQNVKNFIASMDGLLRDFNPDGDKDGDGVTNVNDAFPNDSSESVDTDRDGVGNNADTDDDGDGVEDSNDAFPLNPDESSDLDGDGIGDNSDSDIDGDGVPNDQDDYPTNPDLSERIAYSPFPDIDGDGDSDMLAQVGSTWSISYSAQTDWEALGMPNADQPFIFGDVNDDQLTDVLTVDNGNLVVYENGSDTYQITYDHVDSMTNVRPGDFNGDGVVDLLRVQGSYWQVSYGATSDWVNLGVALDTNLKNLRFGDFNGDRKTDIFKVTGNKKKKWKVSYGGVTSWQVLNGKAPNKAATALRFADFNGDGITDVFYISSKKWFMLKGGKNSGKVKLKTYNIKLKNLMFGDFNGDAKTDVMRINSTARYVCWEGKGAWVELRKDSTKGITMDQTL